MSFKVACQSLLVNTKNINIVDSIENQLLLNVFLLYLYVYTMNICFPYQYMLFLNESDCC